MWNPFLRKLPLQQSCYLANFVGMLWLFGGNLVYVQIWNKNALVLDLEMLVYATAGLILLSGHDQLSPWFATATAYTFYC